MKYIGIDVSSKKLNIHITGKISLDFEIPNTQESLEQFIKEQKLSPKNCVVGAESTGRYQLICQNTFVSLGFEFRLINPILTNKKISLSIRKKKTDISDARLIVNLLMQEEGEIITSKQLDITKKTLFRTRKSVVTHRSSIKVLIKNLQLIKDTNPQIQDAIYTLESLVDSMDTCVQELEDNALSKELTPEEKLIQTIPGFAQKLSAIVASEVGDFYRFPSSAQFKAYVGIDPKVIQSGEMLRTGKITKRGNPYLRCAFYLAAQVARIHDPELKQFYDKKISEGKAFRVALCAVARKLCERVYAVVTKGTPYQINRLSLS